MEHRDAFLLEVIADYCDQILASVQGLSYEEFSNNLDIRDACALRALQIGENAGNLSDVVRSKYSQIPWREIIGLRNIIAHEYGDVDDEVLWEIATIDVPKLRDECRKILG